MLITSEYKEQNRLLHSDRPDYGSYGSKWADLVWQLAHQYKIGSVLDYGAGKQTLHKTLIREEHVYRFKNRYCCQDHPWLKAWQNYDPAVEGLDDPPRSADLVICTDVLEHIEPDCLYAVLDDIARCTQKAALLVIATRPAKKNLPDGRNAHLIQQPIEFWLRLLMDRFTVKTLQNFGGEFLFIGEPMAKTDIVVGVAA